MIGLAAGAVVLLIFVAACLRALPPRRPFTLAPEWYREERGPGRHRTVPSPGRDWWVA